MNCIKCNGTTSVLDSRRQETSAVKRRRKCGTCDYRFNTIEQVLTKDIIVKETVKTIVKTNNRRFKPINPFNDDAYLDSLSDDELEGLIGEDGFGEELEIYR
jgi:transcriptional regulator NrdR family protein